MNLSKNEIIAFISIILKKNPIINITLDEQGVVFTHFDGKQNTVFIETTKLEDMRNSDRLVEDTLKTYVDETKKQIQDYIESNNQKAHSKIDEIEQKNYDNTIRVENLIQEYVDSLNLDIVSIKARLDANDTLDRLQEAVSLQIDETFKNIQELIDKRFLEESFLEKSLQRAPETQITQDKLNYLSQDQYDELKREISSEKYDDTNLVLFTKQIYDELKNEISAIEIPEKYDDTNLRNELDKIRFGVSELSESIPININYQYIENIIDTKVSNAIDSIKSNHSKFIIGIRNKNNRLVLDHNDGTFQDITDIFIPILQINFRRHISTPSTGFGFGGGGGSGRPGLSAYDIAVVNGFVGSEQDWLESLKGGGEPPIPEDGIIVYNAFDQIEQILVGSKTTTFVRDDSGTILSVVKDRYTQTFLRDSDGRVIGWQIV